MSPSHTLELLGGSPAGGRKAPTSLNVSDILRGGLPFAAVTHLKNGFALSDERLATILDVTQRTLSRMRSAQTRLSLAQSDRLYRVAGLVGLAEEVFESREAALQWLCEAQIGLNQRLPIEEMMTEAGAEEVRKLLYRIEHSESI